jgi:hypothetical protein
MNDQLIDRLVAGELDEPERGNLLEWLDEQPGRWRRCALAFLEAQLWQEALGGMVGHSHQALHPAASKRHVLRGGRIWPFACRLSAVAATLLVVFGLGLVTGSAWSVGHGQDLIPVGQLVNDSMPNLAIDAVSQNGSRNGDPSAKLTQASHDRSPVQTFAVLKIATKDAGTREIHLPVQEGSAVESRWLSPQPQPLPEYLQRQLAQRGFEIQQRRRFLEVQLEDGRNAVIPVDQYQVRFVGHRSS